MTEVNNPHHKGLVIFEWNDDVKMGKLSEMPNIGKELETRLETAGILTARQLKNTGSCRALQLLYATDPTLCINMLYAFVGKVQEIRWHKLDPDKKHELQHFFKMLKKQ
jgi:DNA transformation protein